MGRRHCTSSGPRRRGSRRCQHLLSPTSTSRRLRNRTIADALRVLMARCGMQVFSARAGCPALAGKCKGSMTDLTVNVRRMDSLGECMPECLHQVGARVAGVGRTHTCPVVSLMLLVVERVFDAFDEQDIKHVWIPHGCNLGVLEPSPHRDRSIGRPSAVCSLVFVVCSVFPAFPPSVNTMSRYILNTPESAIPVCACALSSKTSIPVVLRLCGHATSAWSPPFPRRLLSGL